MGRQTNSDFRHQTGANRRKRKTNWTYKPTVQDIAKEANVSTATVSRALNQPNRVSNELKERVQTAIKKFDYLPSAAARTLASNRSHTIGAVVPTFSNAIFSTSIAAFERILAKNHYTLLLTVSNYDQDHEAEQVRSLLERGVDGILLVGLDHDAATWRLLEKSASTFVTIWGYQARTDVPYIGLNNAQAAAKIIDHLTSFGHERLGILAGITTGNDRAEQRLTGFKRGMKKNGLKIAQKFILEKPYTHQDGRDALDYFFALPSPPSAIVCGNDVLAMGVMFEAQAKGIRIPQDLSVTGFDNLPITEHLKPALTTIDIPSSKMGAQAAEALLAAIEEKEEIRSKCLPAPLIVRETTGEWMG